MIFKAKHFFHERSLHTTVHKLRGTSFALRHASRKNILMIFVPFLPKNEISLQEHDFSNFVYFVDRFEYSQTLSLLDQVRYSKNLY